MSRDISPPSDKPLISIVIPVYNDAARLRKTLEALQDQTYPSDRYEILVVDNGSTDESPDLVRTCNEATLLHEVENTSSPYSARNRGIEVASGEIIVLLDATCVPARNWIEEGVKCLEEQGADLIGGNVEFSFYGAEPTAGEIYDALTNCQMEESIQQGKAKTANLFIRRSVFDAIGLFPEGIRSGGDVRWTRQATDEGLVLSYCAGAKVYKPARRLRALIKKQWRVAKGKPAIWRQEGREMGLIKLCVLSILPPAFQWVKEKAENRGYLEDRRRILKLWCVRYVINFVMRTGQGYAVLRYSLGSRGGK